MTAQLAGLSDDPAEDFRRIVAALTRRTGDPDYAVTLTADVFRTAWAEDRTGTTVGYCSLLSLALRAAAAAVRDADAAAARQPSDAGAIASLRVRDREVLRMVYWDELSMAELAEFLGCSMAQAGIRLDRAYRRAERRLQRRENRRAQTSRRRNGVPL
ncbi:MULTISPECIES: sigma factor-like helix-turn-helix DNA-binding protein [Micrococcaceae]|uniref:RNA polymerase sigma factor n=1 Tax=Micrococcaceae TaxID=1268 RepID=UPI001CFF6BA3|nr:MULTISPECIES: sigma factor-like helix-turn-helix DNA-binding protein [Micrococcaceae]MCB5283413.1 hypothetical protein [Arthrobacter sp. ES1]MDJ0353391.1 sigma factor-like helix-turn-helix DNA-binding protein [Pseudarthrobacter sp. PH31-O2]WGZ80514.1 sigma factor-like helix-turn-helix DNA-binding protein [Arthrobacter sp. EM1]